MYSAKVKKNKMASYWQKTSVGAPALKMDEKVSFRGYGAAKTAALEENRSYNRKSGGSTSAAAAIANDVSTGDDISVVAATKATVNAEDGFRARVVELVSLGKLSARHLFRGCLYHYSLYADLIYVHTQSIQSCLVKLITLMS